MLCYRRSHLRTGPHCKTNAMFVSLQFLRFVTHSMLTIPKTQSISQSIWIKGCQYFETVHMYGNEQWLYTRISKNILLTFYLQTQKFQPRNHWRWRWVSGVQTPINEWIFKKGQVRHFYNITNNNKWPWISHQWTAIMLQIVWQKFCVLIELKSSIFWCIINKCFNLHHLQ